MARRAHFKSTLDRALELTAVDRGEERDGIEPVRLVTSGGSIECRFHLAQGEAGVLWTPGAGGGLVGPAGGMYERLANRISQEQAASLRVDYRRPGDLSDCVLDALLGVAYLALRGRRPIAVVGHSFGGAVAINVGAASLAVAAVAALSSQSDGTEAVAEISPRPLLLIQGASDEVLPEWSVRDIYNRAVEPRQLLLYPGCRHNLDECSEQVEEDLLVWLRDVLRPG